MLKDQIIQTKDPAETTQRHNVSQRIGWDFLPQTSDGSQESEKIDEYRPTPERITEHVCQGTKANIWFWQSGHRGKEPVFRLLMVAWYAYAVGTETFEKSIDTAMYRFGCERLMQQCFQFSLTLAIW
jgi:hypothetical protein